MHSFHFFALEMYIVHSRKNKDDIMLRGNYWQINNILIQIPTTQHYKGCHDCEKSLVTITLHTE